MKKLLISLNLILLSFVGFSQNDCMGFQSSVVNPLPVGGGYAPGTIVQYCVTYNNWNTNLAVPAWTGLPSSTPVPDPIDKYDFSVLFPRKTILPNN